MTDPEPGRCRRTDGKKWRCSKNVVPDQKYCERHMHRGRQRSRKPVEAVEISISSDAMPSVKLNDKLGELKANHGNSDAVGLRLMTPSSSNNGSNHKSSATTISISNTERKKNAYCDTVTTRTHIPKIAASTTALPAATAMRITTTPATAPPLTPATTAMRITTTTTPATAPILTANGNKKIDQNTERKDMSGNAAGYHTSMKSSNNRANNLSFGISPGLGFSPKSVLQGNISKIETPFHRKNIFDDIVEALDVFFFSSRTKRMLSWYCLVVLQIDGFLYWPSHVGCVIFTYVLLVCSSGFIFFFSVCLWKCFLIMVLR